MFPTRSQRQNDRMGRPVISCFCHDLDFSIGFAAKLSICTLSATFSFSLSKQYILQEVCFLHVQYFQNVSNISHKSNNSKHFESFSGRTRHRSQWEAQDMNVPTPYIYIYIYIHIYLYIYTNIYIIYIYIYCLVSLYVVYILSTCFIIVLESYNSHDLSY